MFPNTQVNLSDADDPDVLSIGGRAIASAPDASQETTDSFSANTSVDSVDRRWRSPWKSEFFLRVLY